LVYDPLSRDCSAHCATIFLAEEGGVRQNKNLGESSQLVILQQIKKRVNSWLDKEL
jgi:hypothetical protein